MKVYQHNAFERWPLDDKSVQAIITSPPFYGLRQYKIPDVIIGGEELCQHRWQDFNYKRRSNDAPSSINRWSEEAFEDLRRDKLIRNATCELCGAFYGQYGLEPDFRLFVEHTRLWAKEAWRVLKDDGVFFLNLGDSYGGNNSRASFGGRAGFGVLRETVVSRGMPKCKLLIPHRVAIALIENGWILRSDICWYKPNHLPESVKDRFTKSYENIFMFVKQRRYYFNLAAIREPYRGANGQAPQGLHQPRPNRNTKIDKETCELYSSPRARYHRKGANTGINNKEPYKQNNPHAMRLKENWLSPKYQDSDNEGHSSRAGLNRPLDIVTFKAYKEFQHPIAEYLKAHIETQHKSVLDGTFGKHKWRHWIRTDYSGAALPGVEDWFRLKEILGFDDTFDDKIHEIQKLNIPVFQPGSNPGDVWEIPTQPSSLHHYSMWPEKLVERMILCSTKPGDVVLDPFCGSGTTLLVAERLNRIGKGFELGYFEIIERKLKNVQKVLF